MVEWLQDLQSEQVSSREHQHTSLQDIQGWTGVQGDFSTACWSLKTILSVRLSRPQVVLGYRDVHSGNKPIIL